VAQHIAVGIVGYDRYLVYSFCLAVDLELDFSELLLAIQLNPQLSGSVAGGNSALFTSTLPACRSRQESEPQTIDCVFLVAQIVAQFRADAAQITPNSPD
jgi:hypothetical protein